MLRTNNNPMSSIPSSDLPAIKDAIKSLSETITYTHRASNYGGSYCIFRRNGQLIASYDTLPTTEYILEDEAA
jgi:hypothetical protein